jgi:Holliday junction DNA helicase RuvA
MIRGMISKLTGQIAHIDLKYIVLDVNGVGYKVSVTSDTIGLIDNGKKPITLWTYLAVRENSMDLYGFTSMDELNFFELLITISGIGPKTALGIMNAASIETLQIAVQTGESSHLTKISGIGKKVAEKIIMELKDKIEIVSHTPESKSAIKNDSDALEALKSLGYSQSEARDALKEVSKDKGSSAIWNGMLILS